ncbi:unnamed protein product [Prunus armeniaca]
MTFPKFWTQSDLDWSLKLEDSGSYDVRSEMGWLVYYMFYPLHFTQNTPNDSSHHIMTFPKFWTQSDIDWSVKLDDSGSYDVRSEMEWLVYCIVLSIGFHSKHTKSLLPPYYDVPQVLDSIRYRLVLEIGRFRFWTQSDIDWSVKLHDSGSYDVRSEMEWLFYPLDFTQNTPIDSPHHIMMFPKFWTQSDIDWSVKLDDSGSCDFYPLDFTQNTPNDSSHHIMMFPKFWTQSDIDWSVKLDDSSSYDVRSEMEWLFYRLDFTQNTPDDSSHHIMMFPMFWTQSDIDWSVKLHDSGSYDVRSEMEWLFYPLDFTPNTSNGSSHHIMMFPKFWTQSDIDWSFYPLDFTQNTPNDSYHHIMVFPKFCTQSDIDWSVKVDDSGSYDFYPLDFTQNPPNDSSHHIMMFPMFWTQSDIDWSVKLHDSGSYDVRSEMEWLFYPMDFTQNPPNDSSHHIMMFPMFWTQSDIDWSVKLHDTGSYDVRSEME